MTELSELIHGYGIFLGAYFGMVAVLCIVLILLLPWGCDCHCECECDDEEDVELPRPESGGWCDCGGFTADGRDGTYRWGWHRSECPRLKELGPR
ncbi:MAG: hypothetical protein QOF36_2557 [Microbacteriaceae bacterium]|jgi:hypothetical protein|nr:hypothetical protein [Microbacteriaceae bacterium]